MNEKWGFKWGISHKISVMLAIIISSFAIMGAKNPPKNRKKPQILALGTFHGSEIAAQSGSEWSGLTWEKENYWIKKYQIVIESVNDPLVDSEGEKSGKKVTLKDSTDKPLFLIKNIEGLAEGMVTGFSDSQNSLNSNFKKSLNTKIGLYVLSVNKIGGKTPQLTLSLASGNKKQKIADFSGHPPDLEKGHAAISGLAAEEGIELYWFGDLNRDGYPEIVINDRYNYVVHLNLKLFLGFGGKGKLLEKVAELTSSAD